MYIFKKIFSQFLFPLPLSLLISLVGLFLLWSTRKQKAGKVIVSIGFCLILLLSYGSVSDTLLKPLERRYEPYDIELSSSSNNGHLSKIKYVVVLGGGHTSDQSLPLTSQIANAALVRLVEGIRIYREHHGSKLILSGGIGFDPIPNATIMARIAIDLGVNEKDIVIESRSKDTKDEAKLIKPLVGNAPFILVTSASHMPRSIAMFKKLGMNPIPAPIGHRVKDRQGLRPDLFFPDASSLGKSERAFYEYLGIIWAKLRGQI
ncbi:MAG: envelope biogenesis factor ElyC [Nitrospiria bacterium]